MTESFDYSLPLAQLDTARLALRAVLTTLSDQNPPGDQALRDGLLKALQCVACLQNHCLAQLGIGGLVP